MPRKKNPYEAKRSEPFTNREMQAMTNVSLMTLHLWRAGTATKEVLYARKESNGAVRYPVKRTLGWMRRHDITPAVHPDELDAPTKKSGPPGSKRPAAASAAAARYH